MLAGNKSLGVLLDSYFSHNFSLSFDLLLSALSLHYDIHSPLLAPALALLFAPAKSINVQDLILFTDFISIPQLLAALENGVQLQEMVEDTFIKILSIN